MSKYQVISGDGHIEGPFDMEKLVPKKYHDALPKLTQREDGSYIWRLDHAGAKAQLVVGSNVYSGLKYNDFVPKNACTYWNEDGSLRPGTSAEDAVTRLREQDEDGIDAEVLYWPACFGMMGALAGHDDDAHKAGVRAYNDFLADYCATAPDRLIGCQLLPATGIDDAIAEMEYARSRGLKAISLQNWPNGSGSPGPDDDRFWAASLDLDMRVSPHVSFGTQTTAPHEIMVNAERTVGGQSQLANPRTTMTVAQMILGGVFDRFPDLKVYFAEAEVSWLAGWLQYIDEFYSRWAPFHGIELAKLPSDYVRDHTVFCFISDRMAIPLRDYIGIDLIMWGSDFPHSVGTFPDSKYILDDFFEGVPDEDRYQVLVKTPCDLFDLDPNKELTPTP